MPASKDEISIYDILMKLSEMWRYLLSRWKTILIFGLIGGGIGLAVSFFIKPTYKSTLVFVLEEDSKSGGGGGLASLASSIGIGGMGGDGGLFTSPNLLEFLKTRSLIEKTLLKPVNDPNYKKLTYAELYIKANDLNEDWNEDPKLKNIKYKADEDRSTFSLQKDSILGKIYEQLVMKELSVSQPNDENSILKIDLQTKSEAFCKNFPGELISIASAYYTETKTKKAKLNVDILQKQVDSVRIELFNALSGAASANDDIFGLNPAMNVRRVPSARKQVDVQANSAILTELVKNLEISKMNLLNQTPLIEVIDKPIYPLEKEKFGKVKGIVLGGIIAGFLIVMILLARRFIKNTINKKNA